MSTYAIVKTGGKQYRVEQGLTLLVERLPVADGESVSLEPLLYVDGASVVDGEDLSRVSVEARVVGHERGPKLRVVKFKPKRGYKRRTGHRQNLTRIEVTSLGLSSSRSRSGGSSRAAADPTPATEEANDGS
jgi:large subunit ribosomal protein L21